MRQELMFGAFDRLLQFSANKRFGVSQELDFNDKIGKKAIAINHELDDRYSLDIFKNLREDELIEYERRISIALKNYLKKNISKRNLEHEIALLKNSIDLPTERLSEYELQFSERLSKTLGRIETFNKESLLNHIRSSQSFMVLPSEELFDLFFSISIIGNGNYILVSSFMHESKDLKALQVVSVVMLPSREYEKYGNNAALLFIKGLDRFGENIRIQGEWYRYHYKVIVPLTGDETELMEGTQSGDLVDICWVMKKTEDSIILRNVFALKSTMIVESFNEFKL